MNHSIVFAGTPENAAQTLRALVQSGIEVALVVTKPDKPVGRKKVITESPVAKLATDLGLPTLKTESIDLQALQSIESSGAYLGVIVAYGSILQENALEALPGGWINLHYSLLPAYRGAAPVQRALYDGCTTTGVTIFKLDTGIDTGLVYGTAELEIAPEDNATTLLNKLTELGSSLLLQEIPGIYAGLSVAKRQEGATTPARKVTREDARLDFKKNARTLENIVRASNPEPGAWVLYQGQPFKILAAFAIGQTALPPGEATLEGNRIVLGCANNTGLMLKQVQPAGKTPMDAQDWFRGVAKKVQFE